MRQRGRGDRSIVGCHTYLLRRARIAAFSAESPISIPLLGGGAHGRGTVLYSNNMGDDVMVGVKTNKAILSEEVEL